MEALPAFSEDASMCYHPRMNLSPWTVRAYNTANSGVACVWERRHAHRSLGRPWIKYADGERWTDATGLMYYHLATQHRADGLQVRFIEER